MGGYTSEILYWGYIEPLYWRNYRHVHSFFEVCYAFQGSGRFRIFGEEIEVNQGELFFARPNEPHDIVSSQRDPLGICFWAFTLIPTATDAGRPRTQNAGAESEQDAAPLETILDPLRPLLASFATSHTRRADASPTLVQTIDLLTREVMAKRAGYLATISGLTTNLLIETARLGCNPEEHSPEAQVQLSSTAEGKPNVDERLAVVAQIKRYLQDNYMHPIRLKEIAAQVHLSERHLSRLFGHSTGISIQQYLAEIRIDVAKQLLLEEANLVADVAEATGFTDPRYFSTFFRRYTGETPTTYRQRGGTAFLGKSNDGVTNSV